MEVFYKLSAVVPFTPVVCLDDLLLSAFNPCFTLVRCPLTGSFETEDHSGPTPASLALCIGTGIPAYCPRALMEYGGSSTLSGCLPEHGLCL